MVAQALRFKQFSWYSPKPNPGHSNATIFNAGGDIMFDRPLAANTPTMSQFSAKVDGVARGFTGGIFATGTDLPFTLASPVTVGQRVEIGYNPTGAVKLQDAAGNLVAAFSTVVRNTTP